MIDDGLRQSAIALDDDFAHEDRDRRRVMADPTRLADSAAPVFYGPAPDPAQAYTYPGLHHAAHNDTAPDRCNAAAATPSWD